MKFRRADFINQLLLAAGRPLLVDSEPTRAADIVIVLGTVVRPNGSPGTGMILRVHHAISLLNQGMAFSGKVIMSGRGKQKGRPEAMIMADLAVDRGLSRDQIILETSSFSTAENAIKCKEIMVSKGLRSAIIVTSPYHVRRAVRSFRILGIETYGSAAFLPDVYSLPTHAKVLLHEYSAWVEWWIKSTLKSQIGDN